VAVTVGHLAVELDARTQEFRTAMRGAERRIDKFERKAETGTAKAGSAFRGLIGPIAAVGAALAALGAGRALATISQGAVQAAGAFEGYEIRLRGLLGSQEGANKALETFVELSSETPFAVSQIVEGAAVLASVAGGSREELELLTKTSANIAAQFGIDFTDAATNMQKALASGVAAAERFKDLGVRTIVESITGIPDLTKVSLAEQRQAMIDTFGPDALTPFATAAQDLSETMAGALSNIGDAASNAQRELGIAFAPGVFGAARAVIIPFFNELEEVVKDNQEEITAFTVDGIRKLLRGFQSTLETGASIVDLFDEMGAQLSDLSNILSVTSDVLGIFFDAFQTGLQTILVVIADLGLGVGQLFNLIGQVSDEQVEALRLSRELFAGDLAIQASEFAEGLPERFASIGDALAGLVGDSETFADDLRLAAVNAGLAAAEVENLVDQFVRARKERAAAKDEAVGAAGGVVGPDAETLAALAGFGDLDIDIAEEARLQKARAGTGAALAGFGALDIDIAQEARLQEKRAETQKQAEEDAAEASERLAAGMASNVTSALGASLALVLDDAGLGFAEGLASLSGDLLEESIENALESLEEGLATAFQELDLGGLFGGEGGLGGLGEGLGQALGAGLGIAGTFLARELGGTESTVRAGLVDSAVTSTQQLRGIIAGDTEIPIKEVAAVIRDMNVETVAEQRTTNAILREIRDSTRAGGVGGDTGEAAVAAAVTDELSGSNALG
jgi:hypothetical protein